VETATNTQAHKAMYTSLPHYRHTENKGVWCRYFTVPTIHNVEEMVFLYKSQ